MKRLDLKQSILVMLIKGAEFKDEIPFVLRSGAMVGTLSDYGCLLKHYTKYYNKLEHIQYEFIANHYTHELGELLFEIDPRLFKRATFVSQGVEPGTYTEIPLIQAFVEEILVLNMTNITLDPHLCEILKGEHIASSEESIS